MGIEKGSGPVNQPEQPAEREDVVPSDAVASEPQGATQSARADAAEPSGVDSPKRMSWVLGVAALWFLADVISKILVVASRTDRPPLRLLGGFLYLTETRNSGAAFSLAEGATLLFTALAVVVVAVIVRSASRLRSLPWAIAFGLILGGATGNLIDRIFRAPGLFRGGVVDWISVLDPAGRVWPVFNLADAGIVVGGVTAILLSMSGYEMDRPGRRQRSARERSTGRRSQ